MRLKGTCIGENTEKRKEGSHNQDSWEPGMVRMALGESHSEPNWLPLICLFGNPGDGVRKDHVSCG